VAGINVINLNKKYKLNAPLLKKITAHILKLLRKSREMELEIVFLSDSTIKKLNKKYKRHNRPTDVLSFNLGDIGEVFISSDTAKKDSGIFETEFTDELVLYVIHGILHLFGYRDGSRKARLEMSKKEGELLRYLCENENLSKVLMRP